jgi:hypothetical protein
MYISRPPVGGGETAARSQTLPETSAASDLREGMSLAPEGNEGGAIGGGERGGRGGRRETVVLVIKKIGESAVVGTRDREDAAGPPWIRLLCICGSMDPTRFVFYRVV